jgi:phospholipid/cholesterol/gamma-HCH transport system ATP-binding protein
VISIRNLYHKFGDKSVLEDISLTIQSGESVAIMGASGGGKTTLLRCMSGLLSPTKGEVKAFDINLYRSKEKNLEKVRTRMGIVFQSGALLDYLTVGKNVSFGLERRSKLNKNQIHEKVLACLSAVGLQDAINLMPSELSGGMRKRVGIARALATDPEILFYDEPVSGLDPITAFTIDSVIVDLNKRLKATSIIVSHDIYSVLRTTQRTIFLHEGKVLWDGPSDDIETVDIPELREVVDKAEAKSLQIIN